MRWFKRAIAIAVLSMSTALAGVGATYGQEKQEKSVSIGVIADQQQVADAFFALGLLPEQIRIFDAARRPGT